MRYVSNFLSVHRVRPTDDDEDDANSGYLASDVEPEVSRANLADVLETRIGGHQGLSEADQQESCTHYENSRSVMERARRVADVDADSAAAATEAKLVIVGKLDEVLQAA